MKKLIVLLLALVPLVVGAQALTIEEAQSLARENYPLIERYNLLEQTSQFTLSNIAKGWLPQVTAYGQATYQSDVVSLPEGMQTLMKQMGNEVLGLKKDQYKIGVDVSQTIYDGGAISNRKKVAQMQTEVQQAQVDVDMYALRDRVNNIFFSLLLIDEKMKLNDEVQGILRSNIDKVSAMQRHGIANDGDIDALKAELLTVQQQRQMLEGQQSALRSVLSVYVGRDVSSLVKPSEITPQQSIVRPQLQLFNQQLRLADTEEAALKSALLPKINLFAQGYYGYPGLNMYEDMFSHDWSLNGLIGARISWNIGALYTNKNDKATIANRRQQIENAREIFLFNNRLQTVQENATIANYRKVIANDDEIISLRHNVRQTAERKLEHGIADIHTLTDEISKENQASISKATHEIEMLQHMYSLDNIMGQ